MTYVFDFQKKGCSGCFDKNLTGCLKCKMVVDSLHNKFPIGVSCYIMSCIPNLTKWVDCDGDIHNSKIKFLAYSVHPDYFKFSDFAPKSLNKTKRT